MFLQLDIYFADISTQEQLTNNITVLFIQELVLLQLISLDNYVLSGLVECNGDM